MPIKVGDIVEEVCDLVIGAIQLHSHAVQLFGCVAQLLRYAIHFLGRAMDLEGSVI